MLIVILNFLDESPENALSGPWAHDGCEEYHDIPFEPQFYCEAESGPLKGRTSGDVQSHCQDESCPHYHGTL